MPQALQAGIEYKQFFHYTPFAINKIIDAYNSQKKEDYEYSQYLSWLNGLYVQCAIASCFNKGSKYPENPLEQNGIDLSNPDTAKEAPLTEEEKKKRQVEGLFMFMQVQQANAKLKEKFGTDEEENNDGSVV